MADDHDRTKGGEAAEESGAAGMNPDDAAGAADPLAAAEEKIARLEEELAAKIEEAARNQDLYLRERAEAENYKKRLQRDKAEAIRYANETLIREILPVLDNLELAVEHAELGGNGKSVVEGVQMILRLFRDFLERSGVTVIDASEGTTFDANVHEAVGMEARGNVPPNTVIRQDVKGYRMHDRLIRPARVVVSSLAPPAEDRGSDGSPDEEGEA